MKFPNRAVDKVTLEFTRHELHLARALIEEGRISHECDLSEGQALEDVDRFPAIRALRDMGFSSMLIARR